MEWQVVGVVVVLVGLVISILTPAIKLNTSVTKLSTLVDSLNAKLSTMENNNTEAHRRIYEAVKARDEELAVYEMGRHLKIIENYDDTPAGKTEA